MAHDDKIGANLPCVGSDFFGGFPSHQLCDGIKTQRPQSGNALVKYFNEVMFHLNRSSSEGYFGQHKCTGIDEDG